MGRPRKNQTTSGAYVPKKVQGLPEQEDILSETDGLWSAVLKRFNKLCRVYGFERVEPPLLEDVRLYEQFYKNSPKLVQQTLQVSMPGKSLALRGNLLPGVLRAYYQQKVYDKSQLSKWAFSGFTVSQNAASELQSDFSFGFEVFGAFNHLTEAQVVGSVWEFLQSLGLKDSILEINHIGKEECQVAYSQSLQDFLVGKKYQLCDDCNEHMQGRVLNVLRCNNLDCQAVLSEAPAILDFLDEGSRKHFTSILEALDELGIPYQLNPLYAGPDGHSRTNLVIKTKFKDETIIIGEGGYHESIMQNLCGKNYCCFGFSGSLSKVRQLLEANKITAAREIKNDVFLVPLGELAAKKSLRLFRDLTVEKISVYDHFGNAGVKNQLKAAETYHSPLALIMGQKEAMDEMVILRDVKSGMQEIISYDKIVQEVKKRLGR
ncbi:MAG: ATP phosphoribosyltransferase regulatory subunit [Candidatus Doudnabacteria bacterium]|nr:ATP phosphoribosyltransferase regulatory subunit [Candidatus Doudnabacteria bacterium]